MTKQPLPKKKAVKKKAVRKKAVEQKPMKKADTLDDYGLKLWEREFADYYYGGPDEIRGNATKCYMKVKPRYKESAAAVEGSKLLKTPKIQSYLHAMSKDVAEACGINAQWLLQNLKDDVEADLADIYTENGTLKPIQEWPLVFRRGLISGIDVDELFEGRGEDRERIGDVTKIKLADRLKVKEMIGKHRAIKAFADEGPQTNTTVINQWHIHPVTTKK